MNERLLEGVPVGSEPTASYVVGTRQPQRSGETQLVAVSLELGNDVDRERDAIRRGAFTGPHAHVLTLDDGMELARPVAELHSRFDCDFEIRVGLPESPVPTCAEPSSASSPGNIASPAGRRTLARA